VERTREPEAARGGRRAALRAAPPGAAVLLAVGGLGAADGGYFPPAWGWAALGLLWVAAAALLLRPGLPLSRREAVFLALLAALVGWTALSALWSASAPLSLLDAQRDLVYLAGAGALLLAGSRPSAPWVAGGVLVAAAGLAAANLVLRWRGAGELAGEEAAPVGYANGLGLLAALGVVLALGVAREASWPLARGGAIALAALFGAALALAGSRGALLALAVGLAGLAALARGPAAAFPLVAAAGVAAALALGFAYGSERERYWTVALSQAEGAPLHGTGAGTFERVWLAERPLLLLARDAHSLFLETLGELGIVGLALLAGLLAVPLAAAVAARAGPMVPAAGGAYAAFLAGAAVDWHWELPAVGLAGLACGAALLLAARRDDLEVGGRARWSLLAAAAVLAAAAFVGLAGQSAVAEGEEAVREGRDEAAERLAARAQRLAPWSPDPWRVEGIARQSQGREAAARESFRRALDRDEGDPELWRLLAGASGGEERRLALERAALLDPLGGG
jgi:hypothetical protein